MRFRVTEEEEEEEGEELEGVAASAEGATGPSAAGGACVAPSGVSLEVETEASSPTRRRPPVLVGTLKSFTPESPTALCSAAAKSIQSAGKSLARAPAKH